MELETANSPLIQSENILPVNNFSQPIKTVNDSLTMAITPVNSVNTPIIDKNIKQHKKKTSSCHVLKNCNDPAQLKRKRGRPKKIIPENENKMPNASNILKKDLVLGGAKSMTAVKDINNDNKINSNLLTDLKPEDSNSPTLVKRGRGRPRKITSSTVKESPVLSDATPKKRGRKKKCLNVIENTESNIKSVIENKVVLKDSNDHTMPYNNEINFDNTNVLNNSSVIESEVIIPKCDGRLINCGNLSETDKSYELKQINKSQFISGIEPELSPKLNKMNWNFVPKQKRSKSCDNAPKMRHRKNSLSGDFVFGSYDAFKVVNETTNLTKFWKSLSYLEGGPNILSERYLQKQYHKKFRLELKRSRSFPNCMLLDTVIWRFLVYQQTYNSEELSDTETSLNNELSDNENYREYRSKSVPIYLHDKIEERNNYTSRSYNDLSILSDDNYLSMRSPQIFSYENDFENSTEIELGNSENENKIRRSKRLHTKIKDIDMFEERNLLESKKPAIDYLLHATQIRKENESQLLEARKSDPELEEKLKKLNFTLISNNMFRPNRKSMSLYTPAEVLELRKLKPKITINGEAFICHCKYSKEDLIEGKPGCGAECLNRLLNIECGSSCSLNSFCTNKQFQNKEFKRTGIVKTPGKGYGVFALEDIPSGSFVDEYIGEVIDQHEMLKRMKKKMYNNNNYMVQLKHDEIIDATRKGNITRFINHSCQPNCVAEKWNVLGESRMGFFSKDLILKGEEITFDYSFELFGDTKQQVCYCGTPKCRGFISKKSRTFYDENDYDDTNVSVTSKQEEFKEKKTKISIKKSTNKINKRLQELDQQLTDISKLKNKNRSDLESSTLNLNKLMVHITDSLSQSHILKFIRENDLNCKRLFMNFNGLSIIHSWMVSSNSETLKLKIIQTLSDLPISNRNTITKSKVLDIVADWAKIPLDTKQTVENLEYPESKYEEHLIEIDKLLPNENNDSELVRSSRILWKKWIILKMVFKIPKLERPKEVGITEILNDDDSKKSIVVPPFKPKTVQYHFGKPAVSNQSTKIIYGNIKNKLNYTKCVPGQKSDDCVNTNSIQAFIKIIDNQNQIVNRDKNKAVLEWNKNHRENTALKTNYVNNTKKLVSNKNLSSTFLVEEIPTIISNNVNEKLKVYSETTRPILNVPKQLPLPKQLISTNKISVIKSEMYPIEVIISNKVWSLPAPTASDLNNLSTLNSIMKVPPPSLPNRNKTSNETRKDLCSYRSALTIMSPENVLYDGLHPSIEEQISLMSVQETVTTNNEYLIDLSNTHLKEAEEKRQKLLFKQCGYNLKKLCNQGLLDTLKSPKQNFVDSSPIKILPSLFKKQSSISQLELTNEPFPFTNLFKFVKIKSGLYQNQPSNLIKISHLTSPSVSQKNRNNVFRIKEKTMKKTDSISAAFKLHNKQLSTTPKNINVKNFLNKQCIEIKTKNKFANKILNGLMKRCSVVPKQFTLKLPEDTKIRTLNPTKEIDLHNKLIPTVDNELCAIVKNNGNVLNVLKQKLGMKYDESKLPQSISDLRSITKGSQILLKNIENNRKNLASLKRKLPLPPMENIKVPKIAASVNHISKLNNKVSKTSQTNKSVLMMKPMIPIPDEEKYFPINSIIDSQEQTTDVTTKTNFSSETVTNELNQNPSTSNQIIKINQINNTVLSEVHSNEIRPKPLMKCLPFNKLDCNTSVSELELKARSLAVSLSNSYLNHISSLNNVNNELISPVIDNSNTSNDINKPVIRITVNDDPIVRDNVQNRSQINDPKPKRKCKLPDSMLSLPAEILSLIPDSQREIKYIVDFYHSMATVIVKVLDLYVKKNCKQGRIRNDEDFKFLAKKLNSNILFKELQAKSVEDLRISESVKAKVEQYIKKYMLKFGKVYKRKNPDQ